VVADAGRDTTKAGSSINRAIAHQFDFLNTRIDDLLG
jgi:hypothetical protein